MVKNLVAYAVSWIAINRNVCLKVLFTSVKVNDRKKLELLFWNYTEVYNRMDNTFKSWSILLSTHSK
jgi:hypothetical protein